ncbi:hypothetical protein GGTG_07558 [Gaeumannomyces tritici R3-111a-1]|uniref:Major facilitator superfamily (MFS) profile domain-containing protein n=1 Tax=Gaeumannomyces tritici (strain R3-111a-1) TaxID=644352 RepID=J3P210_GAET3|nr:hypothetical protein GGTG_07558 [Gaeumannomyces tritici R3-111a-1]EJT73702.1 hypothetical protein GGTG_07558 [Gaeumannomyces tritici R3-111a-1]
MAEQSDSSTINIEMGPNQPPATTNSSEKLDPNIVDWDGPDDEQNPRNWSNLEKNVHIVLVSLITLNANLAATMFAPGAAQLVSEFAITNSIVAVMTVSLYVLGFALGPLVLAPLSELYGRLPVYHGCNLVFTAFTVGCAFSTGPDMFLAFRFLAGCAASGPMTVGGGSIADLRAPNERARAMALFTTGPLLGPVLGPIVGGYVSQYIGWRWTFRIILILAGAVGAAFALYGRETNAPVLLRRKAERLRRETGNQALTPKVARQGTPRQMFAAAIVRPLKLLVLSPIVLLISLYTGILFGLVFLLFTTFPEVFHHTYGFSAGTAGLAYLGLGLGMGVGLLVFTKLSDLLVRRAGDGASHKPEDRLLLMKWVAPITPLGLFLYGWSAEYAVHWIVPILGTFFVGLGCLFVMIPGQIYLVDSYGAAGAASALAANLLVRSPFGAFLGLVAAPLYSSLGLGWGNSVLGFICLAFTPVPWLFHRYGETLRTRFALEL